jgi:proteasome lid subunit RPN8/RPN11
MPNLSAGTPRGRDYQPIIDLIIRHGATTLAAQAVVVLAEDLLAQMRREPDPDRQREHAGMVDARAGDRIGPITVGTRLGVGFEAQFQAASQRGVTGAIAVHTHPGSSSFSEADASAFDQAPLVTLLVVVGADGTWYALSLQPDVTPPTRAEIEERYKEAFDHLAPAYAALSNTGSLSEGRAWQELTHDIWDAVAPGLGLRYDRITPGDDAR